MSLSRLRRQEPMGPRENEEIDDDLPINVFKGGHYKSVKVNDITVNDPRFEQLINGSIVTAEVEINPGKTIELIFDCPNAQAVSFIETHPSRIDCYFEPYDGFTAISRVRMPQYGPRLAWEDVTMAEYQTLRREPLARKGDVSSEGER